MKTRLASLILASALTGCSFMKPICNLDVPPEPRCHGWNAPKWEATDRKKMPYIAVLPKPGTRIKAVVILVPGLDGSLCDALSLTGSLVEHGYAVYGSENRTMAFDSWWSRGQAPKSWQRWVDDLQEFTTFVQGKQPGVPIYYHAHSFGAVVALESVVQCKGNAAKAGLMPKGLILQSPAIALMPKPGQSLFPGLVKDFTGLRINYLIGMELKGLKLTRSESWNCAWMKSNNRVRGGYTIGWFEAASKMGCDARLGSVQNGLPPMLALEGKQDRITLGVFDNNADISTKQKEYETYLRDQLAGGHAQLKQYPEGCHLLTEADGKEQVICDIITWLDARAR